LRLYLIMDFFLYLSNLTGVAHNPYTHHQTSFYSALLNVDADHSRNIGRDMVDCIAERDVGYPVQTSDSTEVKQVRLSKTENETSVGSLDSGFSR